MTYKQIQDKYRRQFNRTIKSCWIADVKREMGFEMIEAHNREDKSQIKNWCKDPIIRERIKNILTQNI
jgi:hypothetical protein